MKTNNNGKEAQGAELPTLTQPDIVRWLKRDLPTAINCLDAIYSDPDMLDALATFMHGRYMNSKHKEELKKQAELELHPKQD